jgi:hypothetical protein
MQSINQAPPQPPDAFTVLGASGWFAIKEIEAGYLVGRWKDKKKGRGKDQTIQTEFTCHVIPHGGQCDCLQSQFGKNCCHQKAVQAYQDKLENERRIAEYKAKEEAERLKRNRYLVRYFVPEPHDFLNNYPELRQAIHQMEKLVFTGQASRAVVIDRLEGNVVVEEFPKSKEGAA